MSVEIFLQSNLSYSLASERRILTFWKCSKSEFSSRTCSSWQLRNLIKCFSIFLLRVKFSTKWASIGVLNLSTKLTETVRNVKTRWDEHQNVRKTSEPAKHFSENPDHIFEWKCLLNASSNSRQRKNFEASFIAILGPSLNNQIDTKKLIYSITESLEKIDHAFFFKLMYILFFFNIFMTF